MTSQEKIKQIVDYFGISTEVQAKAMKISIQTVYNKWNDNVDGHSFNEKNYNMLLDYVCSCPFLLGK